MMTEYYIPQTFHDTGGRLRKKYEILLESMYEEINDNEEDKRGMQIFQRCGIQRGEIKIKAKKYI